LPQKKEKIPQTEKLLKLMIKASLSVASWERRIEMILEKIYILKTYQICLLIN
jgi:hypothetical protein